MGYYPGYITTSIGEGRVWASAPPRAPKTLLNERADDSGLGLGDVSASGLGFLPSPSPVFSAGLSFPERGETIYINT